MTRLVTLGGALQELREGYGKDCPVEARGARAGKVLLAQGKTIRMVRKTI